MATLHIENPFPSVWFPVGGELIRDTLAGRQRAGRAHFPHGTSIFTGIMISNTVRVTVTVIFLAGPQLNFQGLGDLYLKVYKDKNYK